MRRGGRGKGEGGGGRVHVKGVKCGMRRKVRQREEHGKGSVPCTGGNGEKGEGGGGSGKGAECDMGREVCSAQVIMGGGGRGRGRRECGMRRKVRQREQSVTWEGVQSVAWEGKHALHRSERGGVHWVKEVGEEVHERCAFNNQ